MIEVRNFVRTFKDEKLLERSVETVLNKEKNIDVSVTVVGRKRMEALNKKYRGKNAPTDVLSFPPNPFFPGDSGEIIICPAMAKNLLRIAIHGTLHLFGYNHKKKKEEEIMKKKEDYYLNLCQNQK